MTTPIQKNNLFNKHYVIVYGLWFVVKDLIPYSWLSKSFQVFAVVVLSLSLKTLRFCVRMKQLTNEVYMDPVRAYSIELVAKL